MAVSEETLPRRRAMRIPRPGRLFFAFVVAAGLGAGLVAGGLAAFHESLAGQILPGVAVAGVNVGGLTAEEARAALTARYGSLAQGGLVVRTSIGSTTVAFADVHRGADIDAMLAEAAAIGRGGSWLDDTIAAIRLRLEPQTVQLRLTYDHDLAATAITSWTDRTALSAIDASAISGATGFGTIPSVEGSRIDDAAALALVDAAMRDPATIGGAGVTAPVMRVAPILTTEVADAVRLSAQRMTRNLVVTNGSDAWTIYGARIRTWISFAWVDGVYRPVLDERKIPAAFTSIGKRVARPVHDAAFLRDKHGRIVGAMADSAGRELDIDATVDRVVEALQSRASGEPPTRIKLPLVAVLPKTTTADVVKTAPLMVKVGGWTTYYTPSDHNGFAANITIPARTLNGTVVQPGQGFDFWAALGEVSFRTGYRLGGAIVGGHSVEGKALAGGICAASTTLFNAALRAGLEIDARQPHWYYITRYPLGLDATVSGSQTMRFRNDTPNAILIRGFASPGIVRFEIWSVPNGRTVTLTRPIVWNVVQGYDTVVKTTAMKAGTSERTEWPVDGKDVSVTRIVRDGSGRVIHRETYLSHYHRMVGINLVGIG